MVFIYNSGGFSLQGKDLMLGTAANTINLWSTKDASVQEILNEGVLMCLFTLQIPGKEQQAV